ncbi:hypothetical protein PR048_000200 [Dryococelus australis]|uniref:Tc1-like transposase DDE domain-containing protein n=1 Tax=Dryococelus australis TaxID=614101 RepID=A0ABQ9IG66_9NEOP|nr:hypothetical protein PR048_000200 [Dryococelus australis]
MDRRNIDNIQNEHESGKYYFLTRSEQQGVYKPQAIGRCCSVPYAVMVAGHAIVCIVFERKYLYTERCDVPYSIGVRVNSDGVLYGDDKRYRQGRLKSGQEATEEEGAQFIGKKHMVLTVYKVKIELNPGMQIDDIVKKQHVLLENAVRRKVYWFYFRNELPTVDKVLAVVNNDLDLSSFPRTTLYHLLKELHFKYIRRGRDSNVRVDATITSSKQEFLSELSACNKGPSAKGKRLIITHIGSKLGFVEGSLISNANTKKQDIQDWLTARNIDFVYGMLKKELLNIVNQHKLACNEFAVDEMARDAGKCVLRIPPYHCELNPIELVWGRIKGFVAAKNGSYKLSDIKVLLEEAIQAVTPDVWNKCVCHVVKNVDSEMWKLDNIIDEKEDTFIINLNDDNSSSSE